MSWIKDNKFVVGLAGGTLVGAILLYLAGSNSRASYEAAKADYQAASGEVESYARMPLYPSAEHRDGKQKAVAEYRKSLESLQNSFDAYRPKELKNVSPQEFTNHLKTVNDEVREAFKQSGTQVPDQFFCGFEGYQGSLANGKATGILEYQLEGVKSLMLALAKSKAGELKNLYRSAQVEETGGEYTAQPGEAARPLPLEITFVAPEKSAREFLSAVVNLEGKFAVIRSIRITSTKKDVPRAADAKFEGASAQSAGAAAPGPASSPFEGGFVVPTDEPAPAPAPGGPSAPVAAGGAPAPAPAPKPQAAESGRILSQVLGNEEVQVFVRLDFLRFLPAQKLP